MSYGTPALKVKGMVMVRLKEDGHTIVLRMPFDQREALIAEDPETYFVTDHYLGAPYVLVRLSKVRKDVLGDLLKTAHRTASRGKKN